MTEKEIVEIILKSHEESNNLMKRVIDRWAIMFIAFFVAMVIIIIGCTLVYFGTDYAYPDVEQSVEQSVEVGKE